MWFAKCSFCKLRQSTRNFANYHDRNGSLLVPLCFSFLAQSVSQSHPWKSGRCWGPGLAPFGTSFPSLPVPQDAFLVQEQSVRDAQPVTTCQLPPVSDYQKLISELPHRTLACLLSAMECHFSPKNQGEQDWVRCCLPAHSADVLIQALEETSLLF